MGGGGEYFVCSVFKEGVFHRPSEGVQLETSISGSRQVLSLLESHTDCSQKGAPYFGLLFTCKTRALLFDVPGSSVGEPQEMHLGLPVSKCPGVCFHRHCCGQVGLGGPGRLDWEVCTGRGYCRTHLHVKLSKDDSGHPRFI